MVAAIFIVLLVLAPHQASNQIPDARKREFIELLSTLPTKGEFYTEEAVDKAGPHLPVLFALTEKDIRKHYIYPFLAISRGLADRKKHREYAVGHFAEVRHPTLKLFWGAMLFDEGAASPEIVRFLKDALKAEARAKLLSQMVGPEFGDFRRRVQASPVDR